LRTAGSNGINVPLVLDVDKSSWKIIMEKVEGDTIKHRISSLDSAKIFAKIGSEVGTMHNLDIIHGDLTTSNILIDSDDKTWLIDFGLGFISNQIEDKAVDLLVLKHTLESSHPSEYDIAFQSFIEGYHRFNPEAKKIIKRMKVVENRVRYRTH
jgi:Kae1-associated kinase Bud32